MDPSLVDYLLYEPEPETGILWIKFNRPERMNALIGVAGPDGSVHKLLEYMRAGDEDPNIRVIVVTGVGRAFCAGIDVRRGGEAAERTMASDRRRVLTKVDKGSITSLRRISSISLALSESQRSQW